MPTFGKWESIESAPKDGTNILVWSNYHAPFVGYWREKWVETIGWHMTGTGKLIDPTITPTHWQPLPLPPTSQGEPK